ncbi:hypothetical protein EOJ36_02565 [Sandaracinomonas limnophila]|uniref:Peptidase S74 domain-containing protein n=1 Tax=Sandaracinomonas limnophila TaxID=1862386 RepID=A0A437PX98_9BACT|nr:tail fiber domain-containing protein [Sandaracinomonas limnophila]RVU26897.1 hypothetical protein EOJ36_02565 [Sandaracinomonas limnophila]
MKTLIKTFIFGLITTFAFGQNKGLNYQAVILDPKPVEVPGYSASGQPLSNGSVTLKFILKGPEGVDYEETQKTTTDEFGLVNVVIGAGTVNKSTSKYTTFDAIVWDDKIKSLTVGVSFNGGASFTTVSNNQPLNFTPYALYASSVDYKNVRYAPTNLSQFINDPGFLIDKDLNPIRSDISNNTAAIVGNTAKIDSNQKASSTQFASINQGIATINTKIKSDSLNFSSTIATINTRVLKDSSSIVAINNSIYDVNNSIATQTDRINNTASQVAYVQNLTEATNNAINNLGTTYENIGNKSTNIAADNGSNTKYPTVGAVQNYVFAATAGFPSQANLNTKENLTNKSTDITADATSNTKYPSVKSVKDYVDAQVSGGVSIADGSITDAKLASGISAVKVGLGNVDNTSDANKPVSTAQQTALNLKENVSNKSTDINADATSTTKYPSVKTIKDYVDIQVSSGTADATSTVKGKIQLGGDLAGTGSTAAAPVISDNAVTTSKVASGAITDAKIANGISAAKVGLGNVDNTSDANKPVSVAQQTALDAKQSLANLSTNLTTDAASLTKYPAVKTIKDYVDAQVSSGVIDATSSVKGKIQLGGDLAGTGSTAAAPVISDNAITTSKVASGAITDAKIATGISAAKVGLGNVDNTSDANKPVSTAQQTALNLKEDAANKSTDITADAASTTKYPAVKTIKDYVDAQVSSGTADATSSIKGKIQLGGDLAGTGSTAAAPIITDNAITSAKLKDGEIVNADISGSAAIVDSKLATIATSGKVSNSATSATSANNASTIVARDASGNFAAGNISASTINGLTPTAQATGFTIAGGTTSKTLTVTDNATVSGTTSGTNTGDQTITLTGDVAGSGTGSFATTIQNNAITTAKISDANVTYAKIQNVSGADKVLGRVSNGAGTIEEIATTGSGNVVRSTSPTLVTPDLGTPSAIDLTNATNVPLSAVTGTLAITKGGTGATTATAALTNLGAQSTANLSTDLSADAASTSKYPSVKTIKDYVDGSVTSGAPDATTTLKGKIQLAGDLGGTGTTAGAPIISDNAITTAKINAAAVTTPKITDGNVTYAKIQNVSSTDKVLGRVSTGAGVVEEIATTGSGNVVRATSPTLVSPDLGTPSAVDLTNATNVPLSAVTGTLAITKGGTGATTATGALTALGAQSVANLSTDLTADAASTTKYPAVKTIKDYVDGSVSSGAPDATTTVKGKIQLAGDLGGTGTTAGAPIISDNAITTAKINAGAVTTAKITDANVTFSKIQNVSATDKVLGRVSSGAGIIEEIATTGSGNVVRATSPTLVTPTLGVASATSINGLTPTALTTGFTIAGGSTTSKTLTVSGDATVSGTTSGTNTGDQTITLTGDVTGTGTGSFAASIASDAVTSAKIKDGEIAVGDLADNAVETAKVKNANITYAKIQNVSATNKVLGRTTAGAGVIEEIATTGTGDVVRANTPTLVTPEIGAATGTSLTVTGQLTSSVATGTAPLVVTSTTPVANLSIGGNAATATTATTATNIAGGAAGSIPYQTAAGTTGMIATGTANQFLTSNGTGGYTWTSASGITGVPYTGATQAVNLGAYDLTVNGLTVGRGLGADASNTALGNQALSSNTVSGVSGTNNTALGYQGLKANTTGYSNTAVGSGALKANIGGAWNTAIGLSAIPAHTNGFGNTSIGTSSSFYLTSGSDNIAIGLGAGRYYGPNSSSNSMLTTSNQSLYIGNATKAKLNSSTNEIVIGYDVSGNGSNTVTIGNPSITDNYLTGNLNGATWKGAVIGNNYGGAGTSNGILKANGSGVVSAAAAGTDYLAPNAAITGATKTKITYDAKGLVTAGADATTADIAASTDKNYVTDAQLTLLGTTSGTNTGDQTITLTGDVTGSGTGSFAATIGAGKVTTAAIADNAVETAKVKDANITYAKIQNVSATDKVLGRVSTGAGVVEEIATTGTGDVVRANTPTLVTPEIGVATGTSLTVTGQLTSSVATGTAPLVVSSTTPVANLSIGGNAATATTSTNIAGGAAGSIPYQTAAGTTALLATGSANQFLTSNGSGGYTWTSASGITGVPYTGATQAVNLGAYDLTVNGITVGVGTNGTSVTSSNTALGLNALAAANSGTGLNTAVGNKALNKNTTGFNNTAIGGLAMFENTSGTSNTAIGSNALNKNTSGTGNTVIGNSAGYNINSNYNTVIGLSAGGFIKGINNIGIGYAALNMNGSVTSGADNNIAIGTNTLFSAVKPISNVIIGYEAGRSFTNGSYNVVLGQNSAYELTSATNNTILGNSSGRGLTTGSENTILGANVGSTVALSPTLTRNIILADGQGNIRAQHDGTNGWTLGTITSGTWNGTAIGVANGGTGATTAADALTNLGAQATANLSNDLSADAASTTKYPAVKTIKDYVDAQVSPATPDASSSVKGKIQLGGDLAGTGSSAAAPVISDNAIVTAKIKDAEVTYAKIQNVSATDKVLGRVSTGAGVVEEIGTVGTGDVVRATNPTLVTPNLGIPSAIDLTNATNLPISAVSGTLSILKGGTGASTAGAALTALGAQATANLSTDLTTDAASTTKYPAVKTIKDYVDAGDAAINTLADGKIYLGNASNVATEVTPSGDVTMTNAGVTAIGSGKVLTSMLAADAVTSAKIKDGEIVVGDLADNAIETAKVKDANITYAKIQNVSASNVVLGRTTTGAGVIEEIATTGSGNVVRATSPSLVTPVLGAATGTSLSVSGQLTSTVATGTAPLVVTSTTPVANLSIGGNAATATSATTATNIAGGAAGSVPYQTAAGTTSLLAKGTDGQVLTLASGVPSWAAPTGITSVGTINASSTANGAIIASGVLKLAPADGTNGGVVTTTTQTFAGNKTFSSDIMIGNNRAGNGSGSGATYNSGFGSNTLVANTSGNFNVAMGGAALSSNTTGAYNTAIGYSGLGSNTTGNNNLSAGFYAGADLRSNNNVALGYSAIRYARSDNNTAIGYLSGGNLGYGPVTGGANNIFLGYQSGLYYGTGTNGNNTTGLNSVLIGYDVRPAANAETNEIVIAGYNGTAGAVGLGNNTTLLGNNATQKSQIMGALTVVPNTAAASTDGNSSTIAAQDAGAGGNNNGGNINLTPGAKTGTGTAGIVQVNGQIKITGGTPGAGKVLTSDADGLATWSSGGSGVTTMAPVGTAPNANGASISGSTLTLQPADGTNPGLVSTGAQTFAGAKTLTSVLTVSPTAAASAAAGASTSIAAQSATTTGFGGGGVSITAGNGVGTGYGGNINIIAGTGNSTGGDINLTPGASGLYGKVKVNNSDLYVNSNSLRVGAGNSNLISNTGVGVSVLNSITSGGSNTAMGYYSLYSNQNGTSNTAVGNSTLKLNSSGSRNTAIGDNAMFSNTSSDNTALGESSLKNNTSGMYNVAVGNSSGFYNQTGSNNTSIGYQSLYASTATSTNDNTAIGYRALSSGNTGGYNTVVGSQSGYNMTTGIGNTALGYYSLYYNTVGSYNTSLGYSSGPTSTTYYSSNSVFMGYNAKPQGTANSSDEIAIGANAIGLGTGSTVIGSTSTQKSQIMGALTVVPNAALTSAHGNSSTIAAQNATTTAYNGGNLNLTAGNGVGTGTGGNVILTPGTGGTAGQVQVNGQIKITGGSPAAGAVLTSDATGLATWATAGGISSVGAISGTSTANGASISSGVLNLAPADGTNGGVVTTAAQTFAGLKTFTSDLTVNGLTLGKGGNGVSDNTAIGVSALTANTTGYYNTAVGYNSLFTASTSKQNTAIGYATLKMNTADANTAVGYNALTAATTGANNSGFGNMALLNTTTGTENTAMGTISLRNNTTGSYNTAIGARAGYAINSGDNNTFLGSSAGTNLTTGSNNVILGNKAGVYIGSGQNLTAGSGNVLIGNEVSTADDGETNEIVISGYSNTATAVGLGSNTTVIGNTSTQKSQIMGALTVVPNTAAASTDGNNATFAAQNAGTGGNNKGGDINITSGNAAGSGFGGDVVITMGTSTTSSNNGSLLINSSTKKLISSYSTPTVSVLSPSGQDGFTFKSEAGGNNVFNLWSIGTAGNNMIAFHKGDSPTVVGTISVTTTATTYNTTSDYRLKTDFKDFNGSKLLDSIKVYDYLWKVDGSRSYGVKAHELQQVIPYAVTGEKDALNTDGTIKAQTVDYSKIVPVLVKAVQEQEAKLKDVQKENQLLKEQLEQQNKRLERLEKLLER